MVCFKQSGRVIVAINILKYTNAFADNNFVITLVLKRKLIDYILDHVNLYLVVFGPLNTHQERKGKDNGLNN